MNLSMGQKLMNPCKKAAIQINVLLKALRDIRNRCAEFSIALYVFHDSSTFNMKLDLLIKHSPSSS